MKILLKKKLKFILNRILLIIQNMNIIVLNFKSKLFHQNETLEKNDLFYENDDLENSEENNEENQNITHLSRFEQYYSSLLRQKLPINDIYIEQIKTKLLRIENAIEILRKKNEKKIGLSNLEIDKISELKCWPLDNSQNCSICLIKSDENVRILPCKHLFHKNCIDIWLRMKNFCPMCKNKINF